MKNKTLTMLLFAGTIAIQACNSNKNSTSTTDSAVVDKTAVDTMKSDTMAVDTSATSAGKDQAMFMEQAAIGGMMEIEAGKIAQKNAGDAKVKDFAAMMVKDHTKAGDELMAIAKKKKVTLPMSLPAKEQAHLDEMKKLTGAEFDKHYMSMMVNDHKKTVDLFKFASTNADAHISGFAGKTLTVIESHYKAAQDLSAKLK